MIKRSYLLGIIMIISLVFLAGCSKIRIIDFEGLKYLPENPSRVVFGSNSNNFDEQSGRYGDPIEYEVPNEKIAEVVIKLLSVIYKVYPENVDIDLSPIIRYLIFHDENGDTWKVELGIRIHGERWYYPVNDNDLIDFLYESTVQQPGTFCSLEEAYDNHLLTVEDLERIANYYNKNESIVVSLKSEVSSEIIESIKYTYLVMLREQVIEANIDGIHITAYYGTYGNSLVVGIQDDWIDHDLKFEAEYFIGGVLFKDYAEITVSVWKKN